MGSKTLLLTWLFAGWIGAAINFLFLIGSVKASECKVHYYSPGDYILGGLFDNLHDEGCQHGKNDHRYEGFATLHKIEAMVFALEQVNKRMDILPGISLGFDMYDTCAERLLAVKQVFNQVMNKEECKYIKEDFCSSPATSSPIIGVLGSEWSSITTTVSFNYGAFHLPILSYFSSSDTLSNDTVFPYFLRVIPPDKFQVQAIIAMLKHFYWTSVAFVYTDDSYGRNAFNLFKTATDLSKDTVEPICIAGHFGVNSESDYDSIVDSILSYYDTRVVILFTHPSFTRFFFEAMRKRSDDAIGRFQIIGSDAWGANAHEISNSSSAATGALKIRFVDQEVPQFEEYFKRKFGHQVDVIDTTNPWYHEFTDFDVKALEPGFSKESGVSRVMDSVLTFAYGLDAMLKNECPDWDSHCLNQSRLNFDGAKLLHEMKKLNFRGYNEHNVSFYSDREDIGRYEIVNIQCKSLGVKECHLEAVGKWNSLEQLHINNSAIIWGTEDGEIALSTCEGPPEWRHPWSNIILVINCVGLLFALIVAACYLWNRKHPLIYASGTATSFLILLGVILSYTQVYALVIKPSIASCYFIRVGYLLCFTTHFAPLLVHTVTIYRRFRAVVRNTKRPDFTSSCDELFFSMALIMVQVINYYVVFIQNRVFSVLLRLCRTKF